MDKGFLYTIAETMVKDYMFLFGVSEDQARYELMRGAERVAAEHNQEDNNE